MATITQKCQICEGEVTFSFGTMMRSGDLSWSGCEVCNSCDHRMEMDGGSAPEDLRRLELEIDGTFGLRCSMEDKRAVIFKVVRRFFGLSIVDIKELAGDSLFYRGTEAEVELLKYHLNKEGVVSEVVAVSV